MDSRIISFIFITFFNSFYTINIGKMRQHWKMLCTSTYVPCRQLVAYQAALRVQLI